MRADHLLLGAAVLLGVQSCTEDPTTSGVRIPPTSSSNETGCVAVTSETFALGFTEIPLGGEYEELTGFAFLPGSNEFLLLQKQGLVTHYELSEDRAIELGSFALSDVYGEDDCGLVSLAFDPLFAENHYFYLGYCVDGKSSTIQRLTWNSNALSEIPGSAKEVLTVGDPNAAHPWHNVGSIGFDETGALWGLFGEKTVGANAQNLTKKLGKLIRVVPNREVDGSGYEPASDNPYVGDEDKDESIYAAGLRSPWRGVYAGNGRYFIGDVGANTYEEVNLVTEPGQNFGWPTHEGPCQSDCDGFSDPLVYYGRGNSEEFIGEDPEASASGRRSVWVSGPYAHSGLDKYGCNLNDAVLFGDFFSGWIRALVADGSGVVVVNQHIGHLESINSWGQGNDGYLYVSTYGSYKGANVDPIGRLYRAEPK